MPKISIGADHGAKDLKIKVKAFLSEQGYEVVDHGVEDSSNESVDYPVYARKVAEDVSQDPNTRGVLLCGTGIGMSIAANKIPGIRAALISDAFSAKATREHNNSNIICMGARVINHDRAIDFLDIWLHTDYEGGRHQRRLDLIDDIEKQYCK